MNHSYFYLKMKEHKLKVPYTGKERRVRVHLRLVMSIFPSSQPALTVYAGESKELDAPFLDKGSTGIYHAKIIVFIMTATR